MPVDWWGWQARVREAVGPPGPATRPVPPHAPRRMPGLVLGILVTVGIVGTLAGGVVFGGRPSDAARADPVAATGADAPEPTVVPVAVVPVVDLPPTALPVPPPPPAPVPAAPVVERPSYPVARMEIEVVDTSRPAVVRAETAPIEPTAAPCMW